MHHHDAREELAMQQNDTNTTTSRGLNTPAAVLWASAFVLAGMLISQLGQSPVAPAHAEMVSETASGLSLMTTRGVSSSQEYLAVLDSPAQQLYVYSPTIRDGFQLVSRVELDQAFVAGRQASD
jgi:hypothetical protein